MKPLIISFFAVILFYSVFVDEGDRAKNEGSRKVNAIHSNASDTIRKADSTVFYAKRYSMPAAHNYIADFDY